MAVSKVRDWKPDMEYVIAKVPDRIQVASIMNEAKGNRTMAQLAEKCQTSASTLSRAVNGKNTRAMPIALIAQIANNADKHSDDLFGRLMMANGYVPKDIYDKFPETPLELQYRQRGNCETKACNIIMTELLRRGISVKLLDRSTLLKFIERPFYLSTISLQVGDYR